MRLSRKKKRVYKKSQAVGSNHFLNIVFIASLLLILFLSVSVVTKRIPFNYLSFAQQESPVVAQGPLVGGVTSTSAVVWMRAVLPGGNSVTDKVYARLATSAGALNAAKTSFTPEAPNTISGVFSKVQKVSEAELPWDNTWKSTVEGLTPDTTYYVDIVIDGKSQLSTPYPKFKTFPPQGQSKNFKVGILTDFASLNSNSEKQDPVRVDTFKKLHEDNPDFVVIGGDFWHTDTDPTQGKRDMYKKRYTIKHEDGVYADFINLILKNYALVHFWDDHDIGMNGADKTYIHKEQSYQVLQEFFPVYPLPQNPAGKNGDWQMFSYGNTDFFVLDGRSQRDHNNTPDGQGKSMLDGDNLGSIGQLYWLRNGLKNSTAKWKIIFSPLVFNTTMGKKDAWAGFKKEHDALVQFIKNNNIKGVVAVSGDLHAGAIDDGRNAGVPEMLVPGPNMKQSCFTTGPAQLGIWSHGIYGSPNAPDGCRGYGIVRIFTNPDRIVFRVKDENGLTKLKLRYFLNPSEASKYVNLPDEE